AKFYVEAKKCGVNINIDMGPAYQLRRYGFSAKLPLSILTDFEELGVYDCASRPRPNDKASHARIQYFGFAEYPDRWREIWDVFSRQAVWSGTFDQYAASKRKRGTSEVDGEFLKDIEGWRDSLARNIALRNLYLDYDDLNTAVQRTIDRLIFLRMAEDRGLESYGQLLKLCEQPEIYACFIKMCRKADEKYNSGIFHFQKEDGVSEEHDRLTPALTIDDKVLKPILQNLYFEHGSPYHFGVLPVEILGTVYERFLGKVIRLTAGHQAKVEEKPEVRKAGGVYYTPAYIVNYIVLNTVGKQIEGKSPADLAGNKTKPPFRVLDMACGSGSFLLGAYQFLLDHCLKWYQANPSKKHAKAVYQNAKGETCLSIGERKRILTSHIFGVDIDRQAVETTKLSLLLKALEGENDTSLSKQMTLFHERALPNLSDNIKCGNSLIASDFSMLPEDLVRVNAFDWPAQFPEAMKAGGFDAIIGNPPYIRIQGFPADQVDYFVKHYRAATGNYDIYVNFIERGLNLLSSVGHLGMILPNKYFRTDYGRGLRSVLSERNAVEKIVDFGANQVFEATTYTCLIFLSHNKNSTFKYVNSTANESVLRDLKFEQRQGNSLTCDAWTFANLLQAKVMEKLKSISVRLMDLPADMSRGSSSGDDEIFVIDANDHGIENEILRTPLFASDFGRYSFAPKNKWKIIFPYAAKNVKLSLLSTPDIRQKYPKTFAYLEQNSAKLKKRKQFKEWFGYSAPRNLDLHDRAQIAVPLLADKGLYALIPQSFSGSLCPMASGGFTITLGTTCELKPEFVLGILNSKLLFWVLRQTSNIFRGGWITCTKQYFGELPIVRLNLSNPAEKALYDKLVGLVEKMLALTPKLRGATSESEKAALQNAVTTTDAEIDRLVYELYGLTEEEIKIVEG
ncbi:MAG: Eco57I restriction-modification methylase domain-containing protein, partial [Candidatus Aminicenantes bacterium]|nr:Eco57I restriction-modification methylase domain-containing protein [Candidatus Aminicenantes bacterium]